MTGGFGSAVLELLEEARLVDPAYRDVAAQDRRDPRRTGSSTTARCPTCADSSGSTRRDRGPGPRDPRDARRGRAGPVALGGAAVLSARPDRGRRVRSAGGRPGPGRPQGGLCHDRAVSAETIQAGRRARRRLDQLLVERGLAESRTRAQALAPRRAGPGGRGRSAPGATASRATSSTRGRARRRRPGAVRLARRPQAGGGARRLRDRPGRPDLPRRRRLDRWLHRRPAPAWCAPRLRRRRRARPAGRDGSGATRGSSSLERTNARTLGPGVLPEPVDLAVVDVSFISLAPGPRADRRLLRTGRRPDRRARQAAVRGRASRARPGRRPRPGGPPRGPPSGRRHAPASSAWARSMSSPRRSSGPEGNREFLLHLEVGPGAGAAAGHPAELDRLTDERLVEVAAG